MTIQEIVNGAQAISCCMPRGLYRTSIIYLLNQILRGNSSDQGISLLANLYDHWSFDGTMWGANGRVFSATSVNYGAGLATAKALNIDGTAATAARCLAANDLQCANRYVAGCFWANFDIVAASGIVASSNPVSTSTSGFIISLSASKFRLTIRSNSFTTATVIAAGAWNFCAFNAISDAVQNNFVTNGDGTDNASGATGAVGATTPNPLTVGARPDLLGTIVDGRIGGVTIWTNRQLSLTDIAYLYNGGAGRRYPFFV